MKLVFFGTPEFAAQIAEQVFSMEGFECVGVVSAPDAPVGRKRVLTPSPVSQWARLRDIPVWTPTKVKDPGFIEQIQAVEADVWLVVAYGKILPQSFLKLMPGRVINIHPSRLPQYRGPAPMQAALVHGDQTTATTLMVMDRQMDHGPIIGQREVTLSAKETYPELAERMVVECAQVVREFLPRYVAGEIEAVAQDHERATYVSLLTKQDGELDWQRSAQDLYNQYRAFVPWPGTYGFLDEKKINVEFARVINDQVEPGVWKLRQDEMIIGTGASALVVKRIKPEGKSWMKPADFVNGYCETGAFDQK